MCNELGWKIMDWVVLCWVCMMGVTCLKSLADFTQNWSLFDSNLLQIWPKSVPCLGQICPLLVSNLLLIWPKIGPYLTKICGRFDLNLLLIWLKSTLFESDRFHLTQICVLFVSNPWLFSPNLCLVWVRSVFSLSQILLKPRSSEELQRNLAQDQSGS